VWTCDGNLVIKPDGYDGRFVGSSCTFFDVRRSKNGWVTHADCDDNVYLSAEFKIVGKTLPYRELATSWPENGEGKLAQRSCNSQRARGLPSVDPGSAWPPTALPGRPASACSRYPRQGRPGPRLPLRTGA
jgi:hypothetical protein